MRTRYNLLRWDTAVHSFPALPRDVPIRPAFDLGTPHNLRAEDALPISRWAAWFPSSSPSCGVLDAPSLVLGSLQNHRGGDRAILMHIQGSGLGLPSSSKCASGHSAQNMFPKPRVFSSLEFKPPGSAHGGPDTGPGVRSKEKQNSHSAGGGGWGAELKTRTVHSRTRGTCSKTSGF